MPTWSWIVIAVVVVALVLLAVVVAASMMRHKRSERLKDQFGPEYEHAVETAGDQRAAERELLARERKHNKLDIKELTPESRARYVEAWGVTQTGFVDNPAKSVGDADRLVTEVMRERGYPVDDFEQRAADISVDHPKVVEHYRAAHILHLAQEKGEIGTEAQREAIVHYRALFERLLGMEPETPTEHEREPRAEHERQRHTNTEPEAGTDSPKEARA
ncbi:hypothetical protein [Mycolicibacterium neworleansense]|uniref:Secreted protein n=1 Tax=Mycolicibacterium neworleansense TaxID=146018 RepID=A0A0H5S310_9MYCO|nr:hypothetical protein [Mycolicibacterium neworleansense]CRZ15444.1 hypothetical protein BN2156_02305 [Mycolicibacterium neworleansense]